MFYLQMAIDSLIHRQTSEFVMGGTPRVAPKAPLKHIALHLYVTPVWVLVL